MGLCLDPPEKALVLCVDEKSQIQALDRSQPVLPMVPGIPERRSHDYVRAGTTTLFAALEVATGKVIGSLHRRHRAVAFKKFLAKLDKEVPADCQVHLILDNYATHKTPAVKQWLLAHPRFEGSTSLHFTPTSSSWLNLVERWFAELTQKKLKRGVRRRLLPTNLRLRSLGRVLWISTCVQSPGGSFASSGFERASRPVRPARAFGELATYWHHILRQPNPTAHTWNSLVRHVEKATEAASAVTGRVHRVGGWVDGGGIGEAFQVPAA